MTDEERVRGRLKYLIKYLAERYLAERAALADAHAVIEACHAVIDPEDHPALAARIAAILAPCDVAGVCPTLPPDDVPERQG